MRKESKIIKSQLKNIIGFSVRESEIDNLVGESLNLFKLNARHIKSKYFSETDDVFNYLNSDHKCLLLYFLSRLSSLNGNVELADALFLLNKALSGLDLYHSVVFDKTVLFVHPVGSVVGKAKFEGSTVIYQNVTVGATHANIYPCFRGSCILYSGVSIIGDCTIGDNVIFGAGSSIINMSIPDNSMVVGRYSDVQIKPLLDRNIGASIIKNF